MGKYINLSVGETRNKVKWTIITVSILILIIILVPVAALYQNSEKMAYISTMKDTNTQITDGGLQAIELCTLVTAVWHDSIHKDKNSNTRPYIEKNEDFNQAVKNLYADKSTQDTIEKLKINQMKVDELIEDLKKPPSGMEKYRDILIKYYDAYQQLLVLSTAPSGSYNDYENSVKIASGAFHQLERQIAEILPDQSHL